MKKIYEAGDKVKMKPAFMDGQEAFFAGYNHVLTIADYDGESYLMEEDYMWYREDSIECLHVEDFIPPKKRWEILDLRK